MNWAKLANTVADPKDGLQVIDANNKASLASSEPGFIWHVWWWTVRANLSAGIRDRIEFSWPANMRVTFDRRFKAYVEKNIYGGAFDANELTNIIKNGMNISHSMFYSGQILNFNNVIFPVVVRICAGKDRSIVISDSKFVNRLHLTSKNS